MKREIVYWVGKSTETILFPINSEIQPIEQRSEIENHLLPVRFIIIRYTYGFNSHITNTFLIMVGRCWNVYNIISLEEMADMGAPWLDPKHTKRCMISTPMRRIDVANCYSFHSISIITT